MSSSRRASSPPTQDNMASISAVVTVLVDSASENPSGLPSMKYCTLTARPVVSSKLPSATLLPPNFSAK